MDLDEGSIGVSKAAFLFSVRGAGLRGFYTRDAAHRLNNNFDLAAKKAGMHGQSL
jgi:hypothetical protein